MTLWNSLSFASTVNDADALVLFDGAIYHRCTRAQLRQQLDEDLVLAPTAAPSASSPRLKLRGYNSLGAPIDVLIYQDNTSDPGALVIKSGLGGSTIYLYNNGTILVEPGSGYLDLAAILRSGIFGAVYTEPSNSGQPAQVTRAKPGQSVNLHDWVDAGDAIMCAIGKNGTVKPVSLVDAAAENGTVYYSTDAAALVFKDGGGVVHALY